jgi:chromosome segregation ATPase
MKAFFSSLKPKDWILIALVGIIVLMFVYGMMEGSGYRKQLRDIRKENKEIEKERKSLSLRNKELSKKIEMDSISVVQYQERIDSLNTLIVLKDSEIKNLKKRADIARKELEKTKREIDNLINNPIKRTGEELLNSIKEKTK